MNSGMSNAMDTAGETPVSAATRFFEALRSGIARDIWQSFSHEARTFIVERGVRRGLGPTLAEAILSNRADSELMADFLDDVRAGLERDLESVRLELVEFGPAMTVDEGRTRVVYFERFDIPFGPPLDPLPVGSVYLTAEDGGWKIDRLVPRPGG